MKINTFQLVRCYLVQNIEAHTLLVNHKDRHLIERRK